MGIGILDLKARFKVQRSEVQGLGMVQGAEGMGPFESGSGNAESAFAKAMADKCGMRKQLGLSDEC